MAPRKPLDVRTLRSVARRITSHQFSATTPHSFGFNAGMRCAAGFLRRLASDQEARTQTPAKKRKRR